MLGHPEDIPLILKCLFAIGFRTISMPRDGGEPKHDWSRRDNVEKKTGSKVNLNFFLDPAHTGISGVMYCRNTIINHSEVVGEDVIVVNNPIADNPLPRLPFELFDHCFYSKNDPQWSLVPEKGTYRARAR